MDLDRRQRRRAPLPHGGLQQGHDDVRQAADRIYDLRCRIVHSKENHAEAEALHPFGPEAKRLRHDLHLVRFVAQHVLVQQTDRVELTRAAQNEGGSLAMVDAASIKNNGGR